AEKESSPPQARLTQERSDSATVSRDLPEARGRVENLSQRVTDLDRQLIAQVKEAEMLGSRVTELEGRLSTQGKMLTEREYENNQLKEEAEIDDRSIRELRGEIGRSNAGGGSA